MRPLPHLPRLVAWSLFLIPWLGLGALSAHAAQSGADEPPQEAPSQLLLAPEGEPGEPLIVHGVVYGPDGRTPAAGVAVFAYQADEDGYYTREGENIGINARLRGWLRTDEQGRYEIRTIRPGAYPGSRIPAHIHFRLVRESGEETLGLLQFAGDPFLREQAVQRAEGAGRFGRIRPVERFGEGPLICERDFRLDP